MGCLRAQEEVEDLLFIYLFLEVENFNKIGINLENYRPLGNKVRLT